jgi:hypothetical protein
MKMKADKNADRSSPPRELASGKLWLRLCKTWAFRNASARTVIIDSTRLPVRMREFASGTGSGNVVVSAVARVKALLQSFEAIFSETAKPSN